MSLGPISILNGTPLISQSLNLYPGDTFSLSSNSILYLFFNSSNISWAFSFTPSLCIATGTKTTCIGATLGGNFSPLLSPCAIINAPISLVDIPQDVWYAYSCFPSLFWNTTLNGFVKFCPK